MAWYADPLWTFIGNAAQVLSLVAIALALWEVLKQRRRVAPVEWGVGVIGQTTLDGAGPFHIVEIYNAGTGPATILSLYVVHAEVIYHQTARPLPVVASGERFDMYLTAAVIGDVWVQISWREQGDARRVKARWLPVAYGGSAAAAANELADRWYSLGRIAQFRRRRTLHSVGPGEALSTVARVGRGRDGMLTVLEKIYLQLPSDAVLFGPPSRPEDLPVISSAEDKS